MFMILTQFLKNAEHVLEPQVLGDLRHDVPFNSLHRNFSWKLASVFSFLDSTSPGCQIDL